MGFQRGQHTYAGADDNSFPDYSDVLKGGAMSTVRPLIYEGAPDHSGVPGTSPFFGTVGVFDSHGAITAPIGNFPSQFGGDLPIAQQPSVTAPEPWDNPELT